jgi:predicted O-methyltransferase YrrM
MLLTRSLAKKEEATMLDGVHFHPPSALQEIEAATKMAGWTRVSGSLTGSLLRVLAASKAGGSLLELGTGTGVGSAWIASGMDETSRLTTVDADEGRSAIARRYLGDDPRITFKVMDGLAFMLSSQAASFDLIFVDIPPGKFHHLDEVLRLLKPSGFYVIDHLLPEPDWEEGRAARVQQLVATLAQRSDLHVMMLDWSSGLLVAVRR